ncbi:MAG TPA: hypothetical protein VNT53_07755 [Pseudolysinimonas sp.]|nr:hypothetical protein [Pseudolysinimonas sp.]
MPLPPGAIQTVLERRIAVLMPIEDRLRTATAHPVIAPSDWHGPASAAYGDLDQRVRYRVAGAAQHVSAALAATRLALAEIDG